MQKKFFFDGFPGDTRLRGQGRERERELASGIDIHTHRYTYIYTYANPQDLCTSIYTSVRRALPVSYENLVCSAMLFELAVGWGSGFGLGPLSLQYNRTVEKISVT